jgi:osmotically-inducible protein OsmY
LIKSSVKNGKATLTGAVGSVIGDRRATEDAFSVNGVTSVDNSGVKIDPWLRLYARQQAVPADSDIRKAITFALSLDPRVNAFSPAVRVSGGIVRLDGVVGNLKAKVAAEQACKDVVGVLGVTDFLKVRPRQQPAHKDMSTQLTTALSRDPLLKGIQVGVRIFNGVASLTGTVGSMLQIDEALDLAERIKGVVDVRNHLKIEPALPVANHVWPYYSTSDWTSPLPHLSDVQIKESIEKRLFWSPYIKISDVNVTVDGGMATLTGTVGTWIGWNDVDKAAHQSGATEVENRVKVKNGE